MLDQLQALACLADNGTMRRVSNVLHLSHSAVSKRISTLEEHVGYDLIRRSGRRVELTPAALHLLERTRPLVAQLNEALVEEQAYAAQKISLSVSMSVILSGGAVALANAQEKIAGLELDVQTHHATISVERVRSGETMLALAQGDSSIAPDLESLHAFDQELAIVPSALKPFSLKKNSTISVMAIEPHTEAWKYTAAGLKASRRKWGIRIERERSLQSFSAIAEMARAGFGHGLVPRHVAMTLGISEKSIVRFPKPGLSIPVSLIGRKSTLAMPLVQAFYDTLLAERLLF